MATVNTMATLVGNFREVYGDRIIDLVPNTMVLSKRIGFDKAELLGNYYHQPVDLADEHGITYAAARASSITLLQPTAGQMEDAQVEGAQVFGRARVDYESIARSANDRASFVRATRHVVKRLTKSAGKRLELATLHGRRGLATIGSVSGSGTTRAWVISEASWAAAIWAGSKNMTLDVWAANYSSKTNSNAKVTITSVDMDTRTINVSGNATDLTNITAGMHIFPETGGPTNEFAGIDAIVRNTGTLFNISASTYELWKGRTVSSVGRPEMSKFLDGVRRMVEMGLESDTLAVVSPKCFEVLNSDVAALRKYDQSYSTREGVNGVEAIMYHGQSGKLEIMPHKFQKDGQAHILALEDWHRIGAQDLGFITRGKNGEDVLIIELSDSPESEMRCYFNGALFCDAPARAGLVLDGITYT